MVFICQKGDVWTFPPCWVQPWGIVLIAFLFYTLVFFDIFFWRAWWFSFVRELSKSFSLVEFSHGGLFGSLSSFENWCSLAYFFGELYDFYLSKGSCLNLSPLLNSTAGNCFDCFPRCEIVVPWHIFFRKLHGFHWSRGSGLNLSLVELLIIVIILICTEPLY
jgi:hypothetical protein